MRYTPPAWLPEGHSQTIWSALYARRHWAPLLPKPRERWTTPDADFNDVDRQHASQPKRPLMVLFHGLEGSSDSHYAQAFADWAATHDLNFALPHFRGCSGELNLGPRVYHSGDHAEIDWWLCSFLSAPDWSGLDGLTEWQTYYETDTFEAEAMGDKKPMPPSLRKWLDELPAYEPREGTN